MVYAGGKELIFFDFDSSLTDLLPPSFPQELSEQLRDPLLDIGYQLSELHTALSPEEENRNHLILLFSLKLTPTAADTQYTIQTNLVKVNVSEGRQRSRAVRLFAVFVYLNSASENRASRKIIENLRTHYVCHLRVLPHPGCADQAGSGLEG